MADLDKIDPTFVDDLVASKEAELVAHRYFNMLGRMVVTPPTIVRPTADERTAYADSGDMWVAQRWEIKHRGVAFTDLLSYPFPDVFVDTIGAFDKKLPPPAFYMIFNKTLTAALIIDVKRSRGTWTKTTRHAPSRGRDMSFYACPIGSVAHFLQFPSRGTPT